MVITAKNMDFGDAEFPENILNAAGEALNSLIPEKCYIFVVFYFHFLDCFDKSVW